MCCIVVTWVLNGMVLRVRIMYVSVKVMYVSTCYL
jgi:hypothetical protein